MESEKKNSTPDIIDNSQLPQTVEFGGGIAQLMGEDSGKIQEVPTIKNPFYSEELVRGFAIGSPSYLSSLSDRLKKSSSKVPSGIPEIDYITDGGFSSLSCICGAPGAGKTTLLIQSAIQMAQNGTAVVYITNDMRELDLVAKVISHMSYKLLGENKCFTLRDIVNRNILSYNSADVDRVLKSAKETLPYLHIRDLIYDEQFDKACADRVDIVNMSKIERIFYFYCSVYKKVVFIADSLQQIASYTAFGKEGVDAQLKQFKSLGRKYNATIVLVSTLNRTGYAKEDLISFTDLKESGSIEYDCDSIITLVPKYFSDPKLNMDMHTFKAAEKKDILLSCIKSRDSEERSRPITLVAKGCTFVPYENREEEERTETKKKATMSSSSPPTSHIPKGAENWAVI